MERLEGYRVWIAERYPELAGAPLRINSEGLANEVVIVGEDLVVRFARDEQARADLTVEAQLLEAIRPYVTLQVPHFERVEAEAVVYRFVPGAPLYRHDLLRRAPVVQERIAGELATFLRQLHGVSLTSLPVALSTPSSGRTARWLERLAAIEQELFPILWSDQRDWVRQLFAPLREGRLDLDAYTPVLRHNDLAAYHLLWDPDRARMVGVIDFGVAGAGDAADDFACLINTYGESLLRLMAPVYPLDQATLDRARFLAAGLELQWLLSGLRSNDTSWFTVHLGRARDALPIGAALEG